MLPGGPVTLETTCGIINVNDVGLTLQMANP